MNQLCTFDEWYTACLCTSIGTIAASRTIGRRYPRVRRADHPRGWAVLMGGRVVGVVVLALLLSSAVHFNDPGNPWRRLYEAQGASWQPFSQAMNYRSNGFVGGALYNLPGEPMTRPADYSARTMRELANRYAERAATRNAGRTTGAMAEVNVVLVLSEAFADISRLDGVEAGRDTMRFTSSGPTLDVFLGRSTRGGRAKLLVDGDRVATLSFRGSTTQPAFTHRVLRHLGPGPHTVKLVVLKGRAYLRSFRF